MNTRREFLLSAASAALFAGCDNFNHPHFRRPRLAAQLWSIHQAFWKDPAGCMAGLKAAGYDGVEFAGYNKLGAKELKKMLGDAGMAAMGTHVNGDVALVGDELKRTLDFAAELGLESVTTPHARRDSEDGYRAFGRAMGLAAEAAKPYGIWVGVHSTYHHFTTKYGGKTAWDAMFEEASPLLQQQIDTGNTFHTGQDVVALLKQYPGRHFSVHLKENDPTKTAVLGEKVLDGGKQVPWDAVLGQLKSEADLRWCVVECEMLPDTIEPLVASAKFLEGRI